MKTPCRFMILSMFVPAFIIAGCIFDSDDKKDNSQNTDDEAYHVIGYGYDVTGNYADPTQIKGAVFETGDLPESYTVRIQINHSIFSTESGETIEEYQEQMTAGISISGSYKAFSGAVKTNFSEDYYSLNETSFATVMGKINSYQIAIPTNYARAELLRPYMIDQAKADLDDTSISATEIFHMYGTHVLTGAVMGARLDFNVAMRSSDVIAGKSLSVLAEAEYSSLFATVNASSNFSNESERESYEAHRSLKVNAIGGRSEYAQDIISKNDYDKWIDSIEGNEVFCDFTESGLIPIWEFCSDEDRKMALETAFDTWIASRQIETHDAPLPPRNCILDIQVKNSNYGSSYHQNGLTYYQIDKDLNRNAGGAFIYIYAAIGLDTTTTPFSPITGLVLVNGSSTSCKNYMPGGYTLLNTDLNEGAGGQYIYLCHTRSTSVGDPIRSLEVWNKSIGSSYSYGANTSGAFYDVYSVNGPNPLDLNKGAGGDFIYLLYSRD